MSALVRHPERGLTLTEVTIVTVLAAVVMTGIIVFYLNSQATWIDGSAQAITQREATLALRELTTRSHNAAAAISTTSPSTLTLQTYADRGDPHWTFWADPGDSLLYESYTDSLGLTHPMGALITSRVAAFTVWNDADIVHVDSLRLLTPQGTSVAVSGSAAMFNRGALAP